LRKEEKKVKNVKKRKMGQNVQFWAGEAAVGDCKREVKRK